MDLKDLRNEYSQGTLDVADLDPSPFKQFERWFEQAREAGFSPDPSAMVVATVGANGQPHQRMVLLKELDEQGFVFYTNLESRKGREIRDNALVSLHFPWHPIERQVSVNGEVEAVDRATAEAYFQSRPRGSQVAAWASRQSHRIDTRADLEASFAQAEAKFDGVDVLPLPEFWGGYRVIPHRIEFWQGRRSRMHDRLVYQRQGAQQWTIERLQP